MCGQRQSFFPSGKIIVSTQMWHFSFSMKKDASERTWERNCHAALLGKTFPEIL
jgi:hypothetical protein